MQHRLRKKSDTRKGFSILEVMLSLFILTVGLIATLELTRGSILQTTHSRDGLIASALAQEGIELARSIRDNTAAREHDLATPQIFRYLRQNGSCVTDHKKIHDFVKGRLTSQPLTCTPAAAPPHETSRLSLNSNDLYRHDSTEPATEFHRAFRFANPDNTIPSLQQSIDVYSVVTWNDAQIPTNIESDCTNGKFCIYDKITLTKWILH